jgi:DNA modification methylase
VTAGKPFLYGDRSRWGLIQADSLHLLGQLPDAWVDSVLCDPPYGIDIGDAAWDGKDIRRTVAASKERLSAGEAFQHWTGTWAREALRVLRPGGHLVAFGAPRTFHRLTSGIEDAGLEIRDTLMWLYGSGLPKSRRLPGGLGTALKPSYEPVVVARKPLDGTTPRNLEAWGTGALNTEASRVNGYWPANLALAHAPDCQAGRCTSTCPVGMLDTRQPEQRSRFFYCAKASRSEREAGCEQLPKRSCQLYTGRGRPARVRSNVHPTVKPISVLRWLTRLVTPPGGLVLDPFAGSGSTGIAVLLEGRKFLGIEREGEYAQVARARLAHWAAVAAQEEVRP